MPKRFAVGTPLGLFNGFAKKALGRRRASRALGVLRRACIDVLEGRTLMSATYYVAPWGSDGAAGTLAQPFRTIQEAANAAYWGDTVAIEGGTYHETVKPPHAGVTFTNFNNEAVTISGADQATGFWDAAGNIYEATVATNLGEGNEQVFVDGQLLNEARFPNTSLDPSHPTKATIGAYSNGTIYDSSLAQPNGYWVGAKINLTPGQAWTTYTGTVTASGPGWITVALPDIESGEQPAAGNSYYLYGKFQALDSAGEWYVDSSNHLFLWDQYGDNPSYHDVEVKAREYGFDLSGVSNTTIQGINLFACTIHTDAASTGTVINGISASYITQYSVVSNGWWPTNVPLGIELYGANSTLENSTIAYSAGDGVYVGANNVTINNNTIHDVDYAATDAAAIRDNFNYTTITNNTIYNAGRNGINFRGYGQSILANTIHDVMLQTTDGGGIYTEGDNGGGSVIAYNVIYNVNVPPTGYHGAGIYLDADSSNFIIHDNVTANVQAGLKFNSTSYNETVYNNRIGANINAIETNGWTGFAYDWSGSRFYDNTYYNTSVMMGANVAQWGNAFAGGWPTLPAPTTTTVAVPQPPPPAPASPTPPPPPTAPSYPAAGIWTALMAWQQNNVGQAYGAVGYTYNGSWVSYGAVDFGAAAATKFNANVAVAPQYAGQKIEVFIDSMYSNPIATLTVTNTGGWNNFQWQSANLFNAVSGIHNIYIEFVGRSGIANLKNWQFS
ncbi:MAG TPA: carbohydrate-binding protein [Tepidisphaeraceae bacterium]|jgi:hypothetical protein